MTSCSPLRDVLRARLAQSLPGWEAQRRAWPEHLPRASSSGVGRELVPAAVLIALLPFSSSSAPFANPTAFSRPVRIPLIQRPEDQQTHAGQVAFPGGVIKEGESEIQAALREAREEIGLDPSSVEPLGRLTHVDVEVTGFRIHPVVGWVEHPPLEFRLEPDEVAELYSADPDLLPMDGPDATLRRARGGIEMSVPAYSIQHGGSAVHVWGATAIILAEFLEIWAQSR